MSDTPDTAIEGGAPTPAEADDPERDRDEITEATPPAPGEDAGTDQSG
ncbi:MAG TPA: hypothetical protein VK875_09495 [Euzebyales bacterium]|nr:hypothetical protein [Euzebyales bacterium]